MCVVCFVFVVMSLFLFRTLSFDCEPDTLEKGNEDGQEDFGSFTSEFDTWKVESNSSFVSCESQFLDFDFLNPVNEPQSSGLLIETYGSGSYLPSSIFAAAKHGVLYSYQRSCTSCAIRALDGHLTLGPTSHLFHTGLARNRTIFAMTQHFTRQGNVPWRRPHTRKSECPCQ